MGSVTLRPNVLISGGRWGTSNTVADFADSSDTTNVRIDAIPSQFAGSNVSSLAVSLGFADATGTVPAGRKIQTVQCFSRLAGSYAATSFKHSSTSEFSLLALGNVGTITWTTLSSAALSTPDWTYALVDSITAYSGINNTVGGTTAAFMADLWLVVTYSELPAAPTAVTPGTSTITVRNPTLGGTMSAISSGQSQKMEWQFATDTGFTANVQTVTESSADLRASGATTESPSISALNLSNGTWYMRARAVDQYGIAGPYSATATLTVSVPALAVPTGITPAAGATVTTMQPTLGATFAADAAGRQMKGEWQLATDSGFTANVRGLVELDSDFKTSGATTEILPLASKITYDLGTTWYLRARAVGNDGTTSAWSTTTSFTLAMAAPPTPTSVTPVAGATVATNTPTLGATLSAATEGRTVKAEWQLATDSGFTANVRTVTENDSDLRTSGATTETIPIGSKLFQTVWYLRARAVDQYGQAGAYSAATTFTVAHLPTASPTSPISDAKILYQSTAFNWTFSDPASGDTQTAYQLVVERNDTGAVVYDTAKVASTALTRTLTTANLGSLKDVKLRWKIRVWDADDVVGNYSPYQLFTLSDPPTVTITAPTAGQQITTGQPTVTWTVDASTTQVSRRLVFTRSSDNVVVYDTGTVSSSSLTFTAPVTILENLTSYSVAVTVTDQNAMSSTSTRSFSTLYQIPATVTFTVDASNYETLGYVNIDWSTMSADGFFVDWRVYRKMQSGSTWELVYVTADQSVTSYHDWTATTGDIWQYAVTQTAGRSGVILESSIVASGAYLMVGSHYWLINPLDETQNLKVDQVVSDDYSDDYEEQELIIIGRGRKMNQGTRFGYSGELKCQLRDDETQTAREKRLKLQLIKGSKTTYYLRNPFGDVLEVSVGNLSFSRIAGVGTSEFVDVTVPYREVF